MRLQNQKRLALSVAAMAACAGTAGAAALPTESFSLPYGPMNVAAAPYMDEVVDTSPDLSTWGEKGAIGLQGSGSIYPGGSGYVYNPPSVVAFKFNIGATIDSLNATYGAGNWTIANPTLTMQYTYYANNPNFGAGAGSFETYVVQNNNWQFSDVGSGSAGQFYGYTAGEDPDYETSAASLLGWSGGQADLGATTYNWLSPADNPHYVGWSTDKTGLNQGLLTDTLATDPLLVSDITSASAATNANVSLYLMPNNSTLGLCIFTGGGTSEPTLSFSVVTASSSLVWMGAAATGGDGKTWDIGNNANWNNGSAAAIYTDGAKVTFDNSFVTSNQTIHLNSSVAPTSVTFNNSSGSYTLSGSGGITGATGLTKLGSQRLTLGTVNTYTGATVVDGGCLELAIAGALRGGNALTLGAGASVVVDRDTGLLVLGSLNLDPAGKVDLADNGLVVEGGNLATIIAAVKSGANGLAWNGATGMTSSTAATDTNRLTALGVMQNQTAAGGPVYTSTFDGASGLSLTASDVLVKYTYYGDANLDGKVDGSDYSLIDNGYLAHLTGWQNGDFNYDGVINGSDYTLIDNAFNTQGVVLTAILASPKAEETAQLAGLPGPPTATSVPEPSAFALGGITILRSRRRRRRT